MAKRRESSLNSGKRNELPMGEGLRGTGKGNTGCLCVCVCECGRDSWDARPPTAQHPEREPYHQTHKPEHKKHSQELKGKELIDYIENGNITNSVNLPSITMPRSTKVRICVIHRNIPNVLSSITSAVAADNVNIENLLNKSRGDYAYTMLDVNQCNTKSVENRLLATEGVIRVRVI